jgi:hypothetical protein
VPLRCRTVLNPAAIIKPPKIEPQGHKGHESRRKATAPQFERLCALRVLRAFVVNLPFL